jgi:hypothetical protein
MAVGPYLAPITTDDGLTLVRFAPEQLGVVVARDLRAVRAADLGGAGVLAALNGPMFGRAYRHGGSACERVCYLHIDRKAGVSLPTTLPGRGITISVVGGRARSHPGNYVHAGATVAVQLYPALVENGVAHANPSVDAEHVWRSALSILRDGSLAFAIGKLPMWRFNRALVRAGATWAGYTDGGGSTSLATGSGRLGSGEDRPVPTWLVVRPRASGLGWVGIAAAFVAALSAVLSAQR